VVPVFVLERRRLAIDKAKEIVAIVSCVNYSRFKVQNAIFKTVKKDAIFLETILHQY
jgi:hypothetical protein